MHLLHRAYSVGLAGIEKPSDSDYVDECYDAIYKDLHSELIVRNAL
jgi:hypothetical protein